MLKVVIDSAIPFMGGRLSKKEVRTVFLPGNEITPEVVKDADALIIRTRTKCDSKLLSGTDVKLIASATIGTDHIDKEWCKSHGIEVRNSPGCNAPGVAQYVLSSLFKTGFDSGKHTLGIVGYGNVGHIVDEWAREIGINTLICDPPRAEAGYKDVDYQPLDELLKASDALSLHVPLTKEGRYYTLGLIGQKELEELKPGTIVINSSRGGVVDENALKDSIKEKNLKAIVDVWTNEPGIDPELASLVTIGTPHIAGYSEEGKLRATLMVLHSVATVLGISTFLDGLECKPTEGLKISRHLIESSYDPRIDHVALMKNLSNFETLRNSYNYRHEPFFSKDT